MKISPTNRIKLCFLLILIINLLTVIFWVLTVEEFSTSTNSLLRDLGVITALLGTVNLSLNYVLSARYKFIDKYIISLDKMYLVHAFLGIWAYLLILLHPLFLGFRVLDSNENLFVDFFVPSADMSLGRNLGIFGFWLLTILILITGARKLPYNIWAIIHSFIGIPLLMGAAHALLVGTTLNESSISQVWLAFWIIFGVWSYIYKVFLFHLLGPSFNFRVANINETEELFEITLENKSNRRFKFNAGQFAFVTFLNKMTLNESHPYSMVSSPTDPNVKFSIKKLGDWSSSLGHLKEGDRVLVAGPYGHFTAERVRQCGKQVWIGGGIGITPFISKIKYEKDNPSCDQIYVIYSDNNLEQAVYRDEIEREGANALNLYTKIHLSDTEGYLNLEYIRDFAGGFEDTVFLMCGPNQMKNALKEALIKSGVSKDDIVFEEFEFK